MIRITRQGRDRDVMGTVWGEISSDLQMVHNQINWGILREEQILVLEGKGRIRSTLCGKSCYLMVTRKSGKHC